MSAIGTPLGSGGRLLRMAELSAWLAGDLKVDPADLQCTWARLARLDQVSDARLALEGLLGEKGLDRPLVATPEELRRLHLSLAALVAQDPELDSALRFERARGDLALMPGLDCPDIRLTLARIWVAEWQVFGQRHALDQALGHVDRGCSQVPSPSDSPAAALVQVGQHALAPRPGAGCRARASILCARDSAWLRWVVARVDEWRGEVLRGQALTRWTEVARQPRPLAAAADEAETFELIMAHLEALVGLGRGREASDWLLSGEAPDCGEPAEAQRAGRRLARVAEGLDDEASRTAAEAAVQALAQTAVLREAARSPSLPGNSLPPEAPMPWVDARSAAPRTHHHPQLSPELARRSNLAQSSVLLGKVGLALSGGGLRASLYHLGVLAALADADLLRHVDVLSCVSGGSIVGAQYFLRLRELLARKPDAEVDSADYHHLVSNLILDVLYIAQHNLRTRVNAELGTNLKLALLPRYSYTLRLAEIYRKRLFSRVDGHKGARWMGELRIQPKGFHVADFRPSVHNWQRAHKVSALVLNAASQSTGRPWQFSLTRMGESALSSYEGADIRPRVPRRPYGRSEKGADPSGLRDGSRADTVDLGLAVSASGAIPVLLDPVELPGTTADTARRSHRIRLVDGGLHDNQGIHCLIEEGCDVLLVSDATDRLNSPDHIAQGAFGPGVQAYASLLERVRSESSANLAARERNGQIRCLSQIHMRRGLDARTWPEAVREGQGERVDPGGLSPPVQAAITSMRTDMNAFSDLEAQALMATGYHLARRSLEEDLAGRLPGLMDQFQEHPWRFLPMLPVVRGAPGTEARQELLLQHLAGGGVLAPWISPRARAIAVIVQGTQWLVWSGLLMALLFGIRILDRFVASGPTVLGGCVVNPDSCPWERIGLDCFQHPALCGPEALGALTLVLLGALWTHRYSERLLSAGVGTLLALGGFIGMRFNLHLTSPARNRQADEHRLEETAGAEKDK